MEERGRGSGLQFTKTEGADNPAHLQEVLSARGLLVSRAAHLAGWQRQRLSLACCCGHSPPSWLCARPTDARCEPHQEKVQRQKKGRQKDGTQNSASGIANYTHADHISFPTNSPTHTWEAVAGQVVVVG